MAKVVGDIAVQVGADIGPLQRDMRRASSELDDFGGRAARMAKKAAAAGAAVSAGLAIAGAGAYSLARSAADAGAEIENLSKIAGIAPERFQRLAAGAKTVGIEQDKLSDILKDVNDRVGDFLATGGGPMADFFENIAPKVGVTADSFRDLNSADALQLFITSLEKANVSQADATFYLEAMASDLTALYPLLQNNGAEMARLGDQAQAAGAILSNEAVIGSKELRAELDLLSQGMRSQFTQAILENKDEIIALATAFRETWLPAIIAVANAITNIIQLIGKAVDAYKVWREQVENAPNSSVSRRGSRGGGRDGPNPLLDALEGATLPTATPRENKRAGRLSGSGGDSRVDGGQGEDFLGFGFSAAQGEQELAAMQEHQEAVLEALTRHGEQRFTVVSGQYDALSALNAQYNEKVAQQDEMSAEQKLSHIRGALGDVATLMATENEKLFKIGQAAAIAQASVDGYSAAVSAWDKGMKVGGPAVAAAFTAASLARTGSLISSIASQSIGGGGSSSGGGGSSSSAASSSTEAPTPLEARLIGIDPNALFSGSQISNLLDLLTDEAGDRGLTLVNAS